MQSNLTFVPADIIKGMTTTQKWRAFEKEVLAWFLKDNPSLAPFINLDVLIYGLNPTQPDGFSSLYFQYNGPGTNPRGFVLMKELIKDTKTIIIMKVKFTGVAGVSKEILGEFFNKYKACNKKLWSDVFNISFQFSDGDDGDDRDGDDAVTYKKEYANYYTVSIWLRHFR